MPISTSDARGLFTKRLIAVYKERTMPTAFLRSFFTTKESDSKQISIQVQRGTELISVDVERGTEGNRNQFSKSSEKLFVPPYYREYFDATDLDWYDRLFNESGTVDAVTFNRWLSEVMDKIAVLQDKIERSYELQCAQVLLTGVVTLNSGDNIDFKRKAGSLVDLGAGNYWASAGTDPYSDLESACNFIRTAGKAGTGVFNVIMGSVAYNDFLNNAAVKERSDLRRVALDSIRQPQREATGGVLHGEVACGSYVVRIWTYPEYYDTAAATGNKYIDDKQVIVLPESPNFVLGFAAVPMLLGKKEDVGAGLSTVSGAYIIGEYLDQRNSAHIVDIKSAGVAIPVGVDQIYTLQAVA